MATNTPISINNNTTQNAINATITAYCWEQKTTISPIIDAKEAISTNHGYIYRFMNLCIKNRGLLPSIKNYNLPLIGLNMAIIISLT